MKNDSQEETKDGTTGDLEDLAGPYREEFTLADLSRDALIKLIRAHQKIFVGYMYVMMEAQKKHFGEKKALELYAETYDKHMTEVQIPLLREAANIRGNDVISMFKYFQIATDGLGEGTYEFDMDVKNDYDVGYVGKYCVNAKFFEDSDDRAQLDALCAKGPGSMEHEAYTSICRNFHPKMKMEWPLLPPRKNKEGPFCKWRFWVEEKDRDTVDEQEDSKTAAQSTFYKPEDR